MTRPLRLLIVEDSRDSADLLLRAVRSGGYDPAYEIVQTSLAMRAALERQDWDVITSDSSAPQFSAAAAMSLARELRPNAPLIVVSGASDLNSAVSLMQEGARDYIQKDDLARLSVSIDRVLQETELRHERDRMLEQDLMVEQQQGVERKRALHGLQASEARYRRLFETAQDGILILDADTAQINDVNPFLVRMLGSSREQCLGKKLWEIGAFTDVNLCKAAFQELQRHGYIRYEDLPLQTSDGRSINVEFVSNIYLVDDQKVIQCNIRDITARVQTETDLRVLRAELERRVGERTAELEDLNQELGTFDYSVSHDLRAPLRLIQGAVKALEEDYAEKVGAEGQRFFQIICSSTHRMFILIDAYLRLASLRPGDLRPQMTNLSALVHSIAAELQAGDPARRVEFIVAEDIQVNCDPTMLRIALENLLSNAWKFTSQRAVSRIEFGSMTQSDKTLAYFVGDNGAGFDMKRADHLFGVFQRLHNQQEFAGTGVGLASTRRIVHRHGGRIWAESAVGQGSTFHFTLNT